MRTPPISLLLVALLCACEGGLNPAVQAQSKAAGSAPAARVSGAPTAPETDFTVTEIATFDEPWALAFLPDGRILVTEKRGALKLHTPGAGSVDISGVPAVDYGGQGGLGDVAVHPGFASNGLVYLSYAEAGDGGNRGAAVARGKLVPDARGGGTLQDMQVIWRQAPKKGGRGHYGHRLLFGNDGKLWISSGDRQEFTPAQDMHGNLGKVLRLNDDGSVPADNPFASQGGVAAQVWSLGHRNPLGLAFDAQQQLWVAEMGPRGGDELNRIVRGGNYGWPNVSDGDNYDGSNIPDHATTDEFLKPAISWTPVISPGSLLIYSGEEFPEFKGQALLAGLSSQALVRVALHGDSAHEVTRYPMGKRVRKVAQGAAGELWLLEDGAGARLLKLTKAKAAD